MREINEKTTISIMLVVLFIGGVLWLSNIAAEASNAVREITELKSYIYTELRMIRGRLDTISDKLDK